MKKKELVSVCIPCYNEVDNVRPVYEAVKQEMEKIPEYDYEIVFRDNASTDGSYERLKDIALEDRHVKIIENLANYGPSVKGATWGKYVSGDVVVFLACDLQDPPELIPEFLRYYEHGYRVVAGQKIASDEGRVKYFLRHLFYNIIDYFSETKQYKHISGILLLSKDMYELIFDFARQLPFNFLLAEMRYPVKLVPYRQRARQSGKSHLSLNALFEYSLRSLVLTSTRPIHIVTGVGFVSSVVCLSIGIVYMILKLIYWNNFSLGIVPIIMVVSFIGSLQLFLTGLVGEYLAVVYERVSKAVPSLVKETVNIERPLQGNGNSDRIEAMSK